MKDIQANPQFTANKWRVLFIDFRAAFDRVDHVILFQKLSTSQVTNRTINILKMLYNNYHFTI